MPSKNEQRLSVLLASVAGDGLPSGEDLDAAVERLAAAFGLPLRQPASSWRYDDGEWIEIPAPVVEGQRANPDCDKCRDYAQSLIDWLRDDLDGISRTQPVQPTCWMTSAEEKH